MNKQDQPTKNTKGTMRSLADMPKPVLVLEGIGIILLMTVLLATNGYITLPEILASSSSIITMILVGVGCLVPAMINIIWRAVHGLTFLGMDNKSTGSDRERKNHQKKSTNTGDKADEKQD
ncbi:YbjC family protein [Providencia rustigianii]|uniref:YbjC family protein n=1 Tax=Providencia rustigianii TaxID=158850 RepID=UPI00223EE6C0|nr:YbjC family protein [Providencia rustigianii]